MLQKKKLGREIIFCMQMNIKVSSWDYFLMKVARYVQSTQNRKLVIFLQRVLQLFCVLLSCKTFRYFMGVKPCLLLLVSSHSQTRNFLPEYLNKIIKQQLYGEWFPSLLPLFQAYVFQ